MRGKISISFVTLTALSMILILIGSTQFGIRAQLNAARIFSLLQSCNSFFFNTFKIRHENKVLRQEVARLALESQHLNAYRYENEKLRTLLEFESQKPYKLIAATIIGRASNPVSGTCVINKGSLHGVECNLPVITPDGVYGKVLEVTERSALIQTMFNSNFRISAMDLRTGVQGVVRCAGPGKGIVEQVPINSNVMIDDKMVTSGIGSVFPQGLMIGKILKIEVNKSGLFYSISLKPACKFHEVLNVFILKEARSLSEKHLYKTPQWRIYRPKSPPVESSKRRLKPSATSNDSMVAAQKAPKFPIQFSPAEPSIRIEPGRKIKN